MIATRDGKQVNVCDPTWASTEMLSRVRRKLREVDNRLDVWFCERKGCWKVFELKKQSGRWSWCMDWTGPEGEYRPLEPIEPLIKQLSEYDMTRYGSCEDGVNEFIAQCDSRRVEYMRKREAEQDYLLSSVVEQALKRAEYSPVSTSSGPTARKDLITGLRKEVIGAAEEAFRAPD